MDAEICLGATEARLGPYPLLHALGEGSFAAVYLAERAEDGRRVIIKLARGWDPRVEAMFANEFQLGSRLRHPHLGAVLDHGHTKANRPYVVLAYHAGEPLGDRPGPLAPEDVRQLGLQLARALNAVHAEGLVHRDVTPANVILENGGNVRLVDFGLLAPVGTRSAGAAGTPLYLAPEALRGQPLDGRADLYALGALLYRAACGQAPFEGLPADALWAAVVGERPVPLAERAPGLPPAIAALVMRCLAKEPGDRPASALEVAGQLARLAPAPGPLAEGRWRPSAGFLAWRAWLESPGLFALTGASGLGRSRATREAFFEARRSGLPALVLEPAEGDGAYALVERLWRWAARRAPNAHAGLEEAVTAAVATLWPWAFPAGEPAPGAPERLLEGLQRGLGLMLAELAGHGTVLVAVDNWEAADAASRQVLAGLWGRTAPCVHWLLAGERAPRAARAWALAPFERLEARAWLAECCDEPVSEALAERLVTASAGNPGWMAQALAHWRHAHRAEDAARGLPAIALPVTVEAMLEARWSRLSADQRALLEVLALYAAPFGLDDLLPLSPLLPANWPLELSHAIASGLLAEDGGSSRFAHGWWPGFIRERLEPVRRAKLAEKLARLLEPPAAGPGFRDLGLLQRLARLFALGTSLEPTVRYALEAGRAAARVFANEEALALLALGLEAIGREGPTAHGGPGRFEPERLALRLTMADVQRRTGAFARASETYEACLHDVRGAAERGRLLVSLGKTRQMLNQFVPAREALEAALALLPAAAAPGERLRALTSLGRVRYHLDDREGSQAAYQEALALARASGERAYEAEALSFLGTLWLGAGESAELGLASLHQALGLREAEGDVMGRNDTQMLLGNAYFNLGRFGPARDHFAANRQLAIDVGHVQEQGFACLNLALCEVELGGFQPARALVEAARAHAEASDDVLLAGLASFLGSWVLLQLGDVPAAEGCLADARGHEAALNAPFLRLFGLLCEAERHLFLGAFESARRAAELAWGLVEKGTGSEYAVRTLCLLAEACLQAGQLAQAEQQLARASAQIACGGLVAPQATADWLAGWLAYRQARWPAARAAWASALERARAEGLAPLEVRLLLAMQLLTREDVVEAVPLADLARAYALSEAMRTPDSLALACLGLGAQHAADQHTLLAERLSRRGRELLGGFTQALPSPQARSAFLAHPARAPYGETPVLDPLQAQGHQSRRLEMLLELGTIIGTTRDAERVLELVRAFTLEVTQAERCLLFLNPGRGELVLHGPPASFSQTIVKRASQSHEASCVLDAQSDDELRVQASILDLQVRSVMCVPMVVGSVLHGALYVDSRVMLGAFTPEDLRCVTAIANQAAVALDNARMYAVLRQQAREREDYIRRLEASEAAKAHLEEADRLRAERFHAASHDLRTPLASIKVACQGFAKGLFGELSADQADTLDGIHQSAKTLLNVIDDIMDTAQLDAGRLLLHPRPVAIARPVAEALRMLAALALDKQLALVWDEAALAALPPVRGDERRLGRLLQNLLGNAIKYTERGHVSVAGRLGDGTIELVVADTGPGLPEGRRDQPFERYGTRVEAAAVASSGMGLWLVKSLVDLHEGQIRAESEPGGGTRFVMSLPVWQAP